MASPVFEKLPEEDRPRERLLARGAHSLSSSDLVAILLGTGSGETSVVELARSLVTGRRLDELKTATPEELRNHKGIGDAKACVLLAAIELGRRLYGSGGEPRPRVRRPEDVVAHLPREQFDKGQECFFAFYLDSRAGLISWRLISVGSADICIAHPREIFKGAVREGACKLLVVHTHPSGILDPSREDVSLTRRLRDAGHLLGIPLVDHVIVSPDGKTASVALPPEEADAAAEGEKPKVREPGAPLERWGEPLVA